MEPKTLLDTDVLSGLMRKTPTALNRARSYQRTTWATSAASPACESTTGSPRRDTEHIGPTFNLKNKWFTIAADVEIK